MKHPLTFEWTDGRTCAAQNMIRVLNQRGIPWQRDAFSNLCAAIGPGSEPVPVEYYHISGQTFGIAPRPVRTRDYFHLTGEQLSRVRTNGMAKGYTREECLILDNTLAACPFYSALLDALEAAEYYRKSGYQSVTILSRINNGYAVLAEDMA